jgi:hypothetical protein
MAAERSFPQVGRPSERPRVSTEPGNFTQAERRACREAEERGSGCALLLQA